MIRRLFILLSFVYAACSNIEEQPTMYTSRHSHYADDTALHTRQILLSVTPQNRNVALFDTLIIGPVELMGTCGNTQQLKQYASDLSLCSDGTYNIELEYSSDDSIVLLLHYYYIQHDDSSTFVSEGVLRLPFKPDNIPSEYDFLFETKPIEQQYNGERQQILLDVERLLQL